jgi:hypothetical protein
VKKKYEISYRLTERFGNDLPVVLTANQNR